MPSASGSVSQPGLVAEGESDLRKLIIAAGAALLVSACSEEAQFQKEETSASLAGGQYEASWKVASLQSVDKTTPATNLKQDASGTTLACIAADGTIDPALFAEDGDSCSANNPYVRSGRMARPQCKREGTGGEVRQSVSGSFKADSLNAEVSTTTYLSGAGDYAMTRTVTAKRVGECPPATKSQRRRHDRICHRRDQRPRSRAVLL